LAQTIVFTGHNGFIPHAVLIFKTGIKTRDHNAYINSSNFSRWTVYI